MTRIAVGLLIFGLGYGSIAQTLLLDPDFPGGRGPDHYVRSIAIQEDGRILIAGNFTNFNGTATAPVARLHPDGTLDASFNAGPFAWGGGSIAIQKVAVLTDGRILLDGYFTGVEGVGRTNLAVLQPDGRLDASFVFPDLLPRSATYSTAYPAPDGGLWVTGLFTNVGGLSVARLAKLDSHGTPDPNFRAPFAAATNNLASVLPLPEGKLLISGTFTGSTGLPVSGVARLHPDGSVDPTFQLAFPPETTRISRLTLLPDGGLVGEISSLPYGLYADAPRSLVRWRPDGQMDPGFAPDFSYSGSLLQAYNRILFLWAQPDGRLLVAGSFLEVNGIQRLGLVRLNQDGSTDLCFDPGLGPDVFALTTATQASGHVLVGGVFRRFEGASRPYLARLRPGSECGPGIISFASSVFRVKEGAPSALITVIRSGPMDQTESVTVATGAGSATPGEDYEPINVNVVFRAGDRAKTIPVTLRPDTKLEGEETIPLALTQAGGNVRIAFPSVATLVIADQTNFFAAGRADTNFVAQLDGPVIAGTRGRNGDWILAVTPIDHTGFALAGSELRRLHANGARDESFGTNRFEGLIRAVKEMPDGSIVAGGEFLRVQNQYLPGLARLSSRGVLDLGYAPLAALAQTNIAIHPYVYDVHVERDGSLICSGSFPADDRRLPRQRLARVRPDGSLHSAFAQLSGDGSGSGTVLAQQPDGSVVLGLVGESVSLGKFGPDGRRDPRFIPPAHTPFFVETLTLTPDDMLLAGGSTYAGLGLRRPALALFASNGGELDSFRRNTAAFIDLEQSQVSKLLAQSDGRVLVAGSLVLGQREAQTTVVRLHADGSWDPSFDSGSGATPRQRTWQGGTEDLPAQISFLELLSDGRLLVGGDFAGFGGSDQAFLVMLLPEAPPGSAALRLGQPAVHVLESAGQLRLDVVRAGEASTPASVLVRTIPIDAISGTDFAALSEKVDFGPGEWRRTVTVLLRDNAVAEPDRQFAIQLTEPSAGIELIEPTRTLATIQDDDVNVEFATDHLTVSEDDGVALVPVRRWGVAGERIRVEVSAGAPIGPSLVEFDAMSSSGAITNFARLIIPDDSLALPDFRTTLQLRVERGNATVGSRATATLRVLDNDFAQSPGRGVAGVIHGIEPAANGGVYVAGDFIAVDGVARQHVARLLPNGQIDPSFDPRGGPDGPVTALAVLQNGGLLVAGDFTSVAGVPRQRLALLTADGAVDLFFDPRSGPSFGNSVPRIFCLATLPDHRLLVGGAFHSFAGHGTYAVARLLPDGRADTSFVFAPSPPSPYAPASTVTELHPLPGGKILAVGSFYFLSAGTPILRPISTVSGLTLASDGSIDPLTLKSALHPASTAAVLADGTLLVGRSSSMRVRPEPSVGWLSIERLHPNGDRDASFAVRDAPDLGVRAAAVRKIVPQTDGRILFLADVLTGDVTNAPGWSVVGRVLPDGQWDPEFSIVSARNPGLTVISSFEFNDWGPTRTNVPVNGIGSVARQSDGIIVLGGRFSEINGEPRRNLARLYPNGSLRGRLELLSSPAAGGMVNLATQPEIPLPYVVEHSSDLRHWSVLQTNQIPWQPIRLDIAPATFGAHHFFRLVPDPAPRVADMGSLETGDLD